MLPLYGRALLCTITFGGVGAGSRAVPIFVCWMRPPVWSAASTCTCSYLEAHIANNARALIVWPHYRSPCSHEHALAPGRGGALAGWSCVRRRVRGNHFWQPSRTHDTPWTLFNGRFFESALGISEIAHKQTGKSAIC